MTGFPIKLGMTECVLDAGRYGLPVLTRHFLHPVGRIRQHDGPKESGMLVY